MLFAYVPTGTSLEQKVIEDGSEVPDNAVWIDLVNPAGGEDKLVERLVGVAIPTREEMQEIELSSRLYVENGARYMTATLMCQSDTPVPKTTPVTFILAVAAALPYQSDAKNSAYAPCEAQPDERFENASA